MLNLNMDYARIFILFLLSWSGMSFVIGDSKTIADSVAKILVPFAITVYFY